MEAKDNFIRERELLIETYDYSISLYYKALSNAYNGQVEQIMTKIRILEKWKERARKQIQEYTFSSLSAVMEHFNITEAQIKSKSRKNKLPLARQLYAYYATEVEKKSNTEAGERILKSRANIIHGREKIKFESTYYPEIRRHMRSIESIMNKEN